MSPARLRTSRARRLGTVAIVGGALLALLATAGPASAHVTVTPTTAQQGATAELTFKVPNEEANANTVEVQIAFPAQYPIAQLLARPVPGWTVTEQTSTLAKPLVTDDGTFTQAVTEVTWQGGSILPGQYQDFAVSADPLPKTTSQMVFKAVQTYSNGDVVRWIDVAQAGQPTPDHPAPMLTLTPANSSDAANTANAAGSSSGNAPAAAASSSSSDGTARALAAAGLAVSVLALIGVALLLRGRRSTS